MLGLVTGPALFALVLILPPPAGMPPQAMRLVALMLAATAKAVGIHPFLLMLPATLAGSCGFMLPVATPPNAIAFASGYITTRQMARAGVALDLLGAVLVTLFVYLLGRPVFGLP